MENKSRKQKEEGKKNPFSTEQIRIARTAYGTRALAECMEAVIKLYMEK
ncbi:MAG: hypothetical protein HFH10_09350 [Dorea sp.]|nr:hypothetical protein [Dorea sp.]